MKHLTAALLALWLVLGATTHAHAEPISAAIGLTALISGLGVSTAVAGAIGGFLVTMAAGLGLNLLSGALMRKRGAADVGGTTGKMQTGGVVPRSFPFGNKAPVTHSLTYWNSFGQDGKTPNAYIAMEFALSDLPIGSGRAALQELLANGTKATWNPGATPGTYGIAIPEFNKDGRDHMWVEVFDGTQTEADAFMVSQFSADPNWPYASTRVGVGVVKVRVICRLNRDLFSGLPSFKFVCKGVPFYDAREDTTAGGDGSQRWSDEATWEAGVENPIAVAYNLIRGVSYDGTWFFGGQTASASQLPFSAFNAAMNECDATITNEDDSTEKQFRCAGEIRLDMEPADVIDDLMRACNGKIGEIGGVYKPHVGPANVAVLSITDDDIRTDEDQTYEPFFGLQDIVNSINSKYVEPGEGWVAKDAPALIDEDLEAIDGGRRQPVDLQYEYVPFARQVQRQNRATLSDYRRERRHALPLAPEAWRLEPAIDFVSYTSERNGYTAKLFSVEGVTDMDGYLAGVMLKEVDPGDYDDVTSIAPTINVPPLVFPPSQGIAGADIDGVTVQGALGRAKAGARMTWDGSELDDVRAVAFQIRVDGETDLTYSGETPESAVAEGEYIVTANLNSATDYEGRLRFVPFTGRETTWSDWIAFTTPDVRTNWGELEEATQAGLLAINTRLQEARALVEQMSAQVQGLEQQVDDNLKFERKRLESVRGSARAELEDVRVVLADDTTALTVRMDTAESAIGANTASIETLETTKVDAAGATAAAQTLLNATFGAGSANVKWRLAALATPSGYDALFEIEASVNGDTGTYKSSGLLIAVLTVASVQVARFEAKADQFLFRLPSGDPVALIDEDGLLIADRFDVQEATSGERTRYTKSGMYVYDSGGTLRVAVGNLTPP
ncbi:MAG: Phage tail fiber protein [Xanthobacteraceae bacterium]|nr:MAG: Phage tail fiber protein [Xanthobacteraceae bacterium]